MRWKVAQLTLDANLKLQQSGDPLKDLDMVVDAAFLQAGSELENLRFEQAMRALSHHNSMAAQLLVGLIQKLTVRHAQWQAGKDIGIAPLKPLKKTRTF